MKYDVFISYSRKDYIDENDNIIKGNIVSKKKELLSENNISFWFDEEGIYSGDEFASVITKAIRDSQVFLFISSANSNASTWTSNEIATALMYNKPIIPFKTDDTPYNDSVMLRISSFDFIDYKNLDKAFVKLINSVKQKTYNTNISSSNQDPTLPDDRFPDFIEMKANLNEGFNSFGGKIIITPTQLINNIIMKWFFVLLFAGHEDSGD